MAKLKKPSKIIFCKFNYPLVEEIAEYYNNKMLEAKYAVTLHNKVLYGNDNELEDQFYFLNATISGETHIITAAGQQDYPSNDPAIVAKLEAYLASKDGNQGGAMHKRSTGKSFDPAILEHERLDKQTFLKRRFEDEHTAKKVVLELNLIYSQWLTASYFILDNKNTVRVLSWYLTTDQIKEAIEKIIEAR